MNKVSRTKIEHCKDTLAEVERLREEHGDAYAIGYLTGALKTAVSELERVAAGEN